jgi:hypothetical protein
MVQGRVEIGRLASPKPKEKTTILVSFWISKSTLSPSAIFLWASRTNQPVLRKQLAGMFAWKSVGCLQSLLLFWE